MRQYKFKENLFIFVGNKKSGGALSTINDFENGLPSYAHLFSNGKIFRYGEEIGNVKDLKFVGWVEVKPNILMAFYNMLTNRGWSMGGRKND